LRSSPFDGLVSSQTYFWSNVSLMPIQPGVKKSS